jgi:hypothetical protein
MLRSQIQPYLWQHLLNFDLLFGLFEKGTSSVGEAVWIIGLFLQRGLKIRYVSMSSGTKTILHHTEHVSETRAAGIYCGYF